MQSLCPGLLNFDGGFWISQIPVTQAAYEHVMGKNVSRFRGPDFPVENVSWFEAVEYCNKLGLRLPTEAEWEYAARAGSLDSRNGPVGTVAWYRINSQGRTQAVRGKTRNDWGLYDTLGNVWEWVADWWGPYPSLLEVDPKGPAAGEVRCVRGAAWNSPLRHVRFSYRGDADPAGHDYSIGFRCAGDLG